MEQGLEGGRGERIAGDAVGVYLPRTRGGRGPLLFRSWPRPLNWPYLDLPKLKIPAEARSRISTKVAFQYSVLPVQLNDGTVQVAVSNPFDTAMLNAVRFDARGPVSSRWPQAGDREGAEEVLRRGG